MVLRDFNDGFEDGNIPCRLLHFVKTEDIWLKSALKVERGILLRKN
jgi:hypothetical protein